MQHWMEEACKEEAVDHSRVNGEVQIFPRPQKFRHELSKVKQMMIFAYDHIRIILADAVSIEVTVNKEYYGTPISLPKKLKNALRRKRPFLQPLILHGTAQDVDLRKPAGTVDIVDSLRDAGTDVSRKNGIKKVFSGGQCFNPSAQSFQPLQSLLAQLRSLKMMPKTVEKMTTRRASSLAFHPMSHKVVVLMADAAGNLSFWDVFHRNEDPIMTQPHSTCITKVDVHRGKPNNVVTTSYDGTLRITDAKSMQVLEPFRSEDAIPILSFDFVTCDVVIRGQSDSKAHLLDLRTGKSPLTFKCSGRKVSVKSISVHTNQSNYFATATNEGTVLLWDQRKPQSCLERLPLFRTVQWCAFSPITGARLLTSSSANEIRIYDTKLLGESKNIGLERIIPHDNNTGRFISPFRPTWIPQREDCFMVGSMKYPREVEIFSADNGAKLASLQHELLASVCSQVAYHPTKNCLVGGNASGRALVFFP